MPMVGTATAAVISPRQRLGDALDHDAEGAGVGGGLGLGHTRVALGLRAALGLEGAVDVSTACGRRPTWPITGMPRWTR